LPPGGAQAQIKGCAVVHAQVEGVQAQVKRNLQLPPKGAKPIATINVHASSLF